ncbi:aldose 1-epimerase [Pseudopedobacter saltans DSM 12145]|uniref:Aldose 1-epimerase n=1 Tax=Pseudopedobacter saltans (strain ATCC 51119 / DSM 12145 / JCM 21818 / CCUG 39354 / LMG 10337 / NBRC 100064 / NCIMB 13643) TaxID=762903 RepID=F0SDI2_PSESL|nr:aldose epimerase family protein [Pseudopedobacter saltans]ADY53965.1 aldose 1-epimerase [Pseudopedobacter saltans DSM 12145]
MKNLNSLRHSFVPLQDKESSQFIVLENSQNTQIGISDFGARITHFLLPTSKEAIDIVLGFDKLEDYLSAREKYHGVTVGPYANRIANGKFSLNNNEYTLAQNNGTNCLHGGIAGFHNRYWDVEEFTKNSVTLSTTTEKGEEGFPGELSVKVKYTLGDDNALTIEYFAETAHDTVINLTNHAYFNLNGAEQNDITAHVIIINSSEYAIVDERCIPTGELQNVENTPFDFRQPKVIAKDIEEKDEQLIIGNGYDHSFQLKSEDNADLIFAAAAEGDISKIRLEVYTTEPAIQFYTGNYLGSGDVGKEKTVYKDRSGFCFETQHHPDSPNRPEFPSTVLKAGDKFYSKTIYKALV